MDIESLSSLLEPLGWVYEGWMLKRGQSICQEYKYGVFILVQYQILMEIAGIGSYRAMSAHKSMGQPFCSSSTTRGSGATDEG